MFQSFVLSFISVFVALDVIGTIPLYLSLSRSLNRRDKQRVVDHSMSVAAVVAIGFMFLGNSIFAYLGISVADFKIAGGLVLLLVSLADLVGRPEIEHRASGSTGIVPLAVPLITGPGVLMALIIEISTVGYPMTLLSLLLNYLLAWVLLRKSDSVTQLIGSDGTSVISKVASLLLAAIAVAMIRSGIFEAVLNFRLIGHS